jgi:hypothetical protein
VAAGETSAPAVGATLRGMIRFEILTAARAALLVPRNIRDGLVIPWLAEITQGAGSMQPAPYLGTYPHYGPLVNVVATRWVGDRADICYPVASRKVPGEAMRVIGTVSGREGILYAWAPVRVAPPMDLLRWAEPDQAERLPSQTIDPPMGPNERAARAAAEALAAPLDPGTR